MTQTAEHKSWMVGLYRSFYQPRSERPVAEWCCEKLRFDEPNNSGPFTTLGREYVAEPLNSFAADTVSDLVLVFGSQTGKTGMIMGGVAWMIANFPSRALWVMPGKELAQSFSETRWQPMLRASPDLASKIPTGSDRHAFKKTQQMLDGGAIVGFIGSNSPSQLSSTPARMVVMDEVDKFKEGTSKEASAVNLAEQRTKSFANPKRIKTSTPTLDTGLIWQEFLKGDQRRYFVPCPHCSKRVVFAWGAEFTVFKLMGCEAFVTWDQSAKISDADWDFDLVRKSAHAVCPHCKGKILDGHKTAMNRKGIWVPTANVKPVQINHIIELDRTDGVDEFAILFGLPTSFRSYHLPSLYAASPETSFGNLAVKFLKEKNSIAGLQGFVNGDLAEPWQNQRSSQERVEIIVKSGAPDITKAERFLTADYHQNQPVIRFAVRDWEATGRSRLVEFGDLTSWEQLEDKQKQHGITDFRVMIDSNYKPEIVFDNCLRHGKAVSRVFGAVPDWVGWIPSVGIPGRDGWRDKKTGGEILYNFQEKLRFSFGAKVNISVFEFNPDRFKDFLACLRSKSSPIPWEVPEALATREYWAQMDAEKEFAVTNRYGKVTGYTWQPWRQKAPNHYFDCEVLQLCMAHLILGISFTAENRSAQVIDNNEYNELAKDSKQLAKMVAMT